MGYKDPEKQKEYQRNLMESRRKKADTSVASTESSARTASPPAVPVAPPPTLRYDSYSTPYAVDKRTRQLFENPGWCLWRCTKLNDEIICLIRDESVTGYPEKYPVFTDAEIRQLNQDQADLGTYRLVIEAKKCAGKVLIEAD